MLLCLADPASSQNKVPRFKDYPVDRIYNGENAPLILTKDDRTFRTRLKEAAQKKPNFAGHYILTAEQIILLGRHADRIALAS
jgi:hypothetical protein